MRVLLLLFGSVIFSLAAIGQDSSHFLPNTAYDIFPGDYADPSIVRDGNDYYITHSTSGLLIWHSTDLLHWTPVARPLPGYSPDVWAPELLIDKGRFYIYYPLKGKVFVISADSLKGVWSKPAYVGIDGIDPGILTDENGKRFIYMDAGRVAPLSKNGLKGSGPLRTVYSGWKYPEDWVVECFCLESPKLVFHEGYYHMISAQGGTSGPGTSHMAVSARSRTAEGPWENSPYNPIVHTWKNTDEYTSKGHGTIFSAADGYWYIVYHAYKNNEISKGRHTLIERIQWTTDNWFQLSSHPDTATRYEVIKNTRPGSDTFSSGTPNLQWLFAGKGMPANCRMSGNRLIVPSADPSVKSLSVITADNSYTASIQFKLSGDATAGLGAFYNASHYIALSIRSGKLVVLRDGRDAGPVIETRDLRFIKMRMNRSDLSFLYSSDGKIWKTYPNSFEVSGFQTNVLGDFGSLRPTMFIKGMGDLIVEAFHYNPETID
ncbi:MAG: glycoside hydrolase [Chitinophagaceae bacterium]|nr:MAG: glycoside hydrolase [Chitinophagaceae bacterium]